MVRHGAERPEGSADRDVIFVGSSRTDLQRMPLKVRRLMGTALHWAQSGGVAPDGTKYLGLHPAARKMKGELAGVIEIRDDHDGNAYRAMYTAKIGDRIYVLHAFQKKSKSGVATPAGDLQLIRKRLAQAREFDRARRGER